MISIGSAHVMCERVFYSEPTLVLTKCDKCFTLDYNNSERSREWAYQLDSVFIAIYRTSGMLCVLIVCVLRLYSALYWH